LCGRGFTTDNGYQQSGEEGMVARINEKRRTKTE
jgi:hypothetical protein